MYAQKILLCFVLFCSLLFCVKIIYSFIPLRLVVLVIRLACVIGNTVGLTNHG